MTFVEVVNVRRKYDLTHAQFHRSYWKCEVPGCHYVVADRFRFDGRARAWGV